jgi:hypothetical protein
MAQHALAVNRGPRVEFHRLFVLQESGQEKGQSPGPRNAQSTQPGDLVEPRHSSSRAPPARLSTDAIR